MMGKHPEGRRVLVINDTPEILQLFETLLSDEGYRVTIDRFTIEMAEMLDRVKADPPELIVLDFVLLAEMKGWQFLQMLKMDRATRAIPVVVCTGAVNQVRELESHLDEMGVLVVLKPFDIDHLLAVIAAALDRDPHGNCETGQARTGDPE